jgi:glycosyltransferase involved in cell wall biosynthesis
MPASSALFGSEVLDIDRCHQRVVLFVLTHAGPGGTLEVLRLVTRELQALGQRVEIVSLYRGHSHPEDIDCDVLVDDRRPGVFGYVAALVKLAKRTRTTRPAAVVGFMPVANLFGAVAAMLAGVRCRISSHHQMRTAQHWTVRALDWIFGTTGAYSRTVVVSESVRDSFRSYPKTYVDRMRVIPNAIGPISPRIDRLTVRNALGIPQDAVLLASIGRLSAAKNALRTVVATARVSDVCIVLVGDGPQRPEVERYIASEGLEGRIILAGQLDHQAAVDILFASDVFVHLSLFEGRSMAMLEALSAGKAILASDIAAQKEVMRMQDGRLAGLAVEPLDEGAITTAITSLARDEKLRRELAFRARALAAELNPAQMGRDYVALLKG